MKDIELLRKIRNEFAHDMNEINFSSQHIANRISELYAVSLFKLPSEATPRERFIKELTCLIAGFQLELEGVKDNEITGG